MSSEWQITVFLLPSLDLLLAVAAAVALVVLATTAHTRRHRNARHLPQNSLDRLLECAAALHAMMLLLVTAAHHTTHSTSLRGRKRIRIQSGGIERRAYILSAFKREALGEKALGQKTLGQRAFRDPREGMFPIQIVVTICEWNGARRGAHSKRRGIDSIRESTPCRMLFRE